MNARPYISRIGSENIVISIPIVIPDTDQSLRRLWGSWG